MSKIKPTEPFRPNRLWMAPIIMLMLLAVGKLSYDKALFTINLIHHNLNLTTIDVGLPSFSMVDQAFTIQAQALWETPISHFPIDKKVVVIHKFKGLSYEAEFIYKDDFGKDATFNVHRSGKEVTLDFDRLTYKGKTAALLLTSGRAVFLGGRILNVTSESVEIDTGIKKYIGNQFLFEVGADSSEVTFGLEELSLGGHQVKGLNLKLFSNLLNKSDKHFELYTLEAFGEFEEIHFDLLWNESPEKVRSGQGKLPIALYNALMNPVKKNLLRSTRTTLEQLKDPMLLLQYDMLKNVRGAEMEKKVIGEYIPHGHWTKNKSHFAFDMKPNVITPSDEVDPDAEALLRIAKNFIKMNQTEKALPYYRDSCGLGSGEACFRLGMESPEKASDIFKLGCHFKSQECCNRLKLLSTNK